MADAFGCLFGNYRITPWSFGTWNGDGAKFDVVDDKVMDLKSKTLRYKCFC
jgi:hypothetical protein